MVGDGIPGQSAPCFATSCFPFFPSVCSDISDCLDGADELFVIKDGKAEVRRPVHVAWSLWWIAVILGEFRFAVFPFGPPSQSLSSQRSTAA
jgi:hypothetical protein